MYFLISKYLMDCTIHINLKIAFHITQSGRHFQIYKYLLDCTIWNGIHIIVRVVADCTIQNVLPDPEIPYGFYNPKLFFFLKEVSVFHIVEFGRSK